MRIFIQPPKPDASPDGLAVRACELLRHSLILSARIGGIINDHAVVLVAPYDAQLAVAVLKRAGMEAIVRE
jgi:hypothetical protein